MARGFASRGKTGSGCGGFTLIEIMVSTLILGLIVSGVLAMIRNSREDELETEYRRQARLIVFEALEDTLYHPSRYAGAPANYPVQANKVKYLNKWQTNQVQADLDITVSPEQQETMAAGVVVRYYRITASIQWPTAAPTNAITFTKRIYRAL